MSNYKGHIAGGTVAGVAAAAVVSTVLKPQFDQGLFATQDMRVFGATCVITAILFGLWPDIDTNSKGQDIFMGFGFVLNVYLFIVGYYRLSALLGLAAMLPIIGKHRGWTHSVSAMILVPAPIVLVPQFTANDWRMGLPYYLCAVAGYASHLLLDGKLLRRPRLF